jgi:hypothetical protein
MIEIGPNLKEALIAFAISAGLVGFFYVIVRYG